MMQGQQWGVQDGPAWCRDSSGGYRMVLHDAGTAVGGTGWSCMMQGQQWGVQYRMVLHGAGTAVEGTGWSCMMQGQQWGIQDGPA